MFMVTKDASRLTFKNNKTIYFRVFKVAGDKVKGDSAQQSFGG